MIVCMYAMYLLMNYTQKTGKIKHYANFTSDENSIGGGINAVKGFVTAM